MVLEAPRILGLTGGIGAGKSFVGHFLEQAGLPLFNCDNVAREAYTASKSIRQQVINLLGVGCYDEKGLPRYDEIARAVFPTSTGSLSERGSLLKDLEQIIHPYVYDRFTKWGETQDFSRWGWGVMESAILWQSGFNHYCDAVIIVTAPEEVRIKRVQRRDGLTQEQVRARMNRQELLSPTFLRRQHPEIPIYTICNDGGQELEGQIHLLLQSLTLL
jgi:dephospho-coA kinase